MHYIRTNWLPLLVILIGFCASLALALAPSSFVISNFIPDDSFYYFQIARNIVHGLGSTFDGVNLTNGYHPLWLLILLPIFNFFSSGASFDVAPIHAALVVSALLNLIIGIALLRICSRYTQSPWIRALALCAWYLNPFNLYAMLNGLETPLSLAFISLFILAAIRVRERPSTQRLIIAGVVGGLMMLARLDNVFYFVVFLAWLAYEHGLVREGISRVLYSGCAATVVVAPWLIWNYLTFGMLLTSSSLATTLVNHQLIIQDNGHSIFQLIKAVIFTTDYWVREIIDHMLGAPWVVLVLLGTTLGWKIFRPKEERESGRRIPLELFLLVGFILIFIADASIRWSPRDWYFISLNLFVVMWIAWLMEILRRHGKLRSSAVIAVSLLTLALFFISWKKDLHDKYAINNGMITGTLWMNTNLPKDAVIGSFNAGLIGYASTHRVINLDGLVNNAALDALKQKDLWDYIRSAHIDYLSDTDVYFTYRFKSFFGIDDPLARMQLVYEEPTTGLHVYKIK